MIYSHQSYRTASNNWFFHRDLINIAATSSQGSLRPILQLPEENDDIDDMDFQYNDDDNMDIVQYHENKDDYNDVEDEDEDNKNEDDVEDEDDSEMKKKIMKMKKKIMKMKKKIMKMKKKQDFEIQLY